MLDERSQAGTISQTTISQGPMGSGSLLSSSETDDWRTSTANIWGPRTTPSPAISQAPSHQPAVAQARTTVGSSRQPQHLSGSAFPENQPLDPAFRSQFRANLGGPSLTGSNLAFRGPVSPSTATNPAADPGNRLGRGRLSGDAKPFQVPSRFEELQGRPTATYSDVGDPYAGAGSSYHQYLAGSTGTAGLEGGNYASTRSDSSSPTTSRYAPFAGGGPSSQPLQASTSLPPSRPAQAQFNPRFVNRPSPGNDGVSYG